MRFQMLKARSAEEQIALLEYQLLQIPDPDPGDREMYEFWLMSDKKVLPYSGGFMEQPARVMNALLRENTRYNIGKMILQIRDELTRMVENARDFTGELKSFHA